MQQAKTPLLESSISTAEIAVICRFADQSNLTRVFTRLVGAPPSGWCNQLPVHFLRHVTLGSTTSRSQGATRARAA
jgi:AraC-like DNA-binding protein